MERPLDRALSEELSRLTAAGLRRTLPDPAAPARVDLRSNDTLGLARDPAVVAAMHAALDRDGAGSGAARLLGGGAEAIAAERALTEWIGGEAALLFPSGWQANVGVIGALAGPGDALCSDALNHASLVDGCRLARARTLRFRHGDLDELATRLAEARSARRRFIVVEALHGMEGDLAPLAALHELAEHHDAWLIVDEAHSTGLLGPRGAGGWAAAGLPDSRLAARVVTGGKALGVAGAFVAGSAVLRDLLLHRARTFLFTTAPPPAVAAGLAAAIARARDAAFDPVRARVLALTRRLAKELRRLLPPARVPPPPAGAIVPFPVGDSALASELGHALDAAGFAVAAVRPPTVPEGGARLRFALHATNDEAQVTAVAATLAGCGATARLAGALRVAPGAALATPWFVVGTGTGVGKTVASALLLRAARQLGAAAYWKPVQTGAESDTAVVAALAAAEAHELLAPLHHFERPASPHEAAAAAGAAIEPATLQAALTAAREERRGARLIVEFAGGLLVPYRAGERPFLQADWLERVRPRLALVAASGLGTLNHTLLTLEALRARRLEPDLLLLVGDSHPANAATLRQLSGVAAQFELPRLEPLDGAALARWLAANPLAEALR